MYNIYIYIYRVHVYESYIVINVLIISCLSDPMIALLLYQGSICMHEYFYLITFCFLSITR
jgi:hypothetical protein